MKINSAKSKSIKTNPASNDSPANATIKNTRSHNLKDALARRARDQQTIFETDSMATAPILGAPASGAPDQLDQPSYIEWIDLDAIERNPFQPRRRFPLGSLFKLARSLKDHTQLQPCLVRPAGEGRYQMVAGERRWRAAREAGIPKLLCVVRRMNDYQAMVASWVENTDREGITPIDVSIYFRNLGFMQLGLEPNEAIKVKIPDNFPFQGVAQAVDLSTRAVRYHLRLLELPLPAIEWLQAESPAAVDDIPPGHENDKKLIRTEKHGRALLLLQGEARLQKQLRAEIEADALSGDAALERARQLKRGQEEPDEPEDDAVNPGSHLNGAGVASGHSVNLGSHADGLPTSGRGSGVNPGNRPANLPVDALAQFIRPAGSYLAEAVRLVREGKATNARQGEVTEALKVIQRQCEELQKLNRARKGRDRTW